MSPVGKTFKRRAILEALAREEFPELDTSRIIFRVHSHGTDLSYYIHNGEEQDIDILIHKKFFDGLDNLRQVVREILSQALREVEVPDPTEAAVNVRSLAPDKEISPQVAGQALATLIERAGPAAAKVYLRLISNDSYNKTDWLLAMEQKGHLSRRLAIALWYFGKDQGVS